MKFFKSFRCDCGGKVKMLAFPGRTREVKKNIFYSIPDDYKIATCEKCKEEYLTLEESRQLDKDIVR